MDSDTVNVSGGVSGLFAALKLAENGCKDVTVLEVKCFSAKKLHSKHNVGDKYKGDEIIRNILQSSLSLSSNLAHLRCTQ